MTKRINQETVEAAITLHEQFVGKQQNADSISLPTYAWASIQSLQRQIDTARQRGWHGAVRRFAKTWPSLSPTSAASWTTCTKS